MSEDKHWDRYCTAWGIVGGLAGIAGNQVQIPTGEELATAERRRNIWRTAILLSAGIKNAMDGIYAGGAGS